VETVALSLYLIVFRLCLSSEKTQTSGCRFFFFVESIMS